MEHQREQLALRELICTLDEAPDFDSDHVGGMIAFAVQRARTNRDQSEGLQMASARLR